MHLAPPMTRFRLAPVLFCLFSGVPTTGLAQPPPKATTYNYKVKKGDTCVSIARKEFGNPKSYHTIHRLNPDMGPLPHHLKAGQLLKLPLPQHPDAEVTATQKKVKARPGQIGSWSNAVPGLAMYRGWRIQTFDASFADLRFVDTSTLSMSPNTMVVIYGNGAADTQKAQPRATLDHGSLRARLAELGKGATTLEVQTPSSKAQFQGGESFVEVSKAGESRIENHGDGVATVKSIGRNASVRLPRSTGTKVVKGQAPLAPHPLPNSPTWQGPSKTTFASNQAGARASGRWQSVPKAVAYRVELLRYAKKATSPETVNVFYQDAAAPHYHLTNLPPGHYAITVATVDKHDFTSIPSAAQRFSIDKAHLKINGRARPIPEQLNRPLQVPYGAQLELPAAARCMSPTIGLAHPRGLITAGTHEVHCEYPGDQSMDPWTLVVEPPSAKSRVSQRVQVMKAQAQNFSDPRQHHFDLSVGTSMWVLQRGQTDPNVPESNERLPTVFFDLGFRYAPLPWLQVGLAQHLSFPRSAKRRGGAVLGGSASIDFVYHKWKFSPLARLHLGYMGLLGTSMSTSSTRIIPSGLDVGIRAPVVRGLSLEFRSGVLSVVEQDLRSVHSSIRMSAQASYRFGAQ